MNKAQVPEFDIVHFRGRICKHCWPQSEFTYYSTERLFQHNATLPHGDKNIHATRQANRLLPQARK